MADETFYYIYLSLIVIGVLILFMKYQDQVNKNGIKKDDHKGPPPELELQIPIPY